MNLSTLRTDFWTRGFESWDDSGTLLAATNRLINSAMHQLNDERGGMWPYLEATATGTAPLTITDLGTLEHVWDGTHNDYLSPADRRDLSERYGDGPLSQTGSPSFFYVANGVVKVYPVEAVSLTVRYWKVAADLSADDDTPLMPARFHDAIVDLAVAAAHRQNSSEGEAQAAQAEAQRKIDMMAERLLGGQQEAGPAWVMPYIGED